MKDFIILAVVAIIVLAAAIYVLRAKKHGQKCIGCPGGGDCSSCGSCGSDLPK